MIRYSSLGVLFFAALNVWAQPCEVPPEVKTAMDAASLSGKPLDERIAAARKVRDQFPADYFAHRFYQELFVSQGLFSKPVREEYKALLDAHSDNTLYLLLYARTLKGTNTPEAIKLLDQVLAREPENPQARQKLLEIYPAPAFRPWPEIARESGSLPESLSYLSGRILYRLCDPYRRPGLHQGERRGSAEASGDARR